MKHFKSAIYLPVLALFVLAYSSCTKLDTKVYNQIENDNFWQTDAQIAAGIAPVYTQLRDFGTWNYSELTEVSTDEIVIPIRGNDWQDGGAHQRIFYHQWTIDDGTVNSAWGSIFGGIGKCNFILDVVNGLSQKPANIDDINAELKVMRAYYYFMALDMFGNVPIVSSFKTDPTTVKNSTRKEVFDFIESELKANVPLLTTDVNAATYGRANRWVGYSILAKLYLNAQVFTGTARWADCAAACDSIILSNKYSLTPGYFDNFSPTNDYNNAPENIFVIPFDATYLGGTDRTNQTLHYNQIPEFGLAGNPYNGWCSTGDFYYGNFDTSSVYTATGGKIYRTFKDQRTGQFLTGQQFSDRFPYPPDKNVLYFSSADSLFDSGLPLYLQPNFTSFDNPATNVAAKMYGARSVKYFPQAGSPGNSGSNDVVVYRLADFLLMRAECIMRGAPASSTGSAADLVNRVRMRAYSGDASHNWLAATITPVNLLAERARELAWEFWRRQDLIRFDVADGTHYFDGARGGTRAPAKQADADTHYRLYPIPQQQHTANNNLVQNPGYPAF